MSIFYGEELLAFRPSFMLYDYLLSAVRDCFLGNLQMLFVSGSHLLLPLPESAP